MYLLYTIVTISYPSKLHGRGGTVTFPVLIGSRGSGFGSKINEVSVQRERGKKRARVFFFLPKGERASQEQEDDGGVGRWCHFCTSEPASGRLPRPVPPQPTSLPATLCGSGVVL